MSPLGTFRAATAYAVCRSAEICPLPSYGELTRADVFGRGERVDHPGHPVPDGRVVDRRVGAHGQGDRVGL